MRIPTTMIALSISIVAFTGCSSESKNADQQIEPPKELSLSDFVPTLLSKLKEPGVTEIPEADWASNDDPNLFLVTLMLEPDLLQDLAQLSENHPKSDHDRLIRSALSTRVDEVKSRIGFASSSLIDCAVQGGMPYEYEIKEIRGNVAFIGFTYTDSSNAPIASGKEDLDGHSSSVRYLSENGSILHEVTLRCEFLKFSTGDQAGGRTHFRIVNESVVPNSVTWYPIPPMTEDEIVGEIEKKAYFKIPYVPIPEHAFENGVGWYYDRPLYPTKKKARLPEDVRKDVLAAGIRILEEKNDTGYARSGLFVKVQYPEKLEPYCVKNPRGNFVLLFKGDPKVRLFTWKGQNKKYEFSWEGDRRRCRYKYEYSFEPETGAVSMVKGIIDVVNKHHRLDFKNVWRYEFTHTGELEYTWTPSKGWVGDFGKLYAFDANEPYMIDKDIKMKVRQ